MQSGGGELVLRRVLAERRGHLDRVRELQDPALVAPLPVCACGDRNGLVPLHCAGSYQTWS